MASRRRSFAAQDPSAGLGHEHATRCLEACKIFQTIWLACISLPQPIDVIATAFEEPQVDDAALLDPTA